MRVISGTRRGRTLKGPGRLPIRPTADRVREALFNVLRERTPGSRVLDLFAGTGAIGIEALSRGAQAATFVEQSGAARRILGVNLERCGFLEAGHVIASEVMACLDGWPRGGVPFDLVVADPPYTFQDWEPLLSLIGRGAMMAPQAIVVLEHAAKTSLPEKVGSLIRFRSHRYGDTALSFYREHDTQDGIRTKGGLP